MKVGSQVYIISGNHKEMEGKVVALSDPKASIKTQKHLMGEQVDTDIDPDVYIGVELKIN